MAAHGEKPWPPLGRFSGRLRGGFHGRRQLGMSSRSITSSEGRPRVVPPRHVRKAVTDSVVGVNEALAGGYPQAATWAGPPLAPSLSATARCLRVEGGLWSPMLVEMAGIDGTGAFQRARTPAQKQQRREAILAAARALALGRVPAITVFSPGLITRIPQGGSAQE